MKSRLIIKIFICLFLKTFTADCQYIPTIEDGKEWTIVYHFGLGNDLYTTYIIQCDTLIQKSLYHIVNTGWPDTLVYVREDTSLQTLFRFNVEKQKEEAVITYKGEVGDTINLYGQPVVITEIKYVNIFGALRKLIITNWWVNLIEGIGASSFGIVNEYDPPPTPHPFVHDVQQTSKTCLSTPSNYIPSLVSISITPNPFADHIFITTSINLPTKYKLINAYGTELRRGSFIYEINIDTDALTSGIYFLYIGDRVEELIKL
jgi:hypothetical protein